jgi:hypothetical protein
MKYLSSISSDNCDVTFVDGTFTGDLTVDTNTLYVDSTNNRVGIGITNPAYPFSVDVDTTGLISRIYNTNADGQGLLIRAGSTSSSTRVLQLASSNDTKIMTVTSSGNVGIGTTNPGFKLHVDKNATGYIARIQGDTNNISFYDGGSSGIGIGTDANQDLKLYVNDSLNSGIVIKSTGNVGIGTTSPSEKLHVTGTILSDQDEARIRFNSTSGTGRAYDMIGGNDGKFYFYDRTATSFRYVIDSSGNVGIGTTSPDALLTVSNTVDNGAAVRVQRTNALSGSYTELGTVGGSGRIESFNGNLTVGADASNTDSSSVIQFKVDNSEKARITSDGNVGIGTTSPSAKLDVNGSLFFRNFVRGYVGSSTTQYVGATWLNASDGYFYVRSANVDKVVLNSNGNSYLNGGNVGIGTTNPGALLSLGSSVVAQKVLLYDASNNFKYGFGIQNSELRQFFPSTSGARMVFGTISDSDGSTFSERMRITSSGNVGIGTTSPSEKLDVAGNIQLNGNYLKLNEGTNAESRIVSSANYLEIIGNGPSAASGARMWLGKGGTVDSGFYVNGSQLFFRGLDSSTKMYINGTSGNVGIGTTSPVSYAKLSVNGNVKIGNGASANILYGGFEGAILNQTAYQGYNIVYSGGDFQSVKLGGTNDPTNYYYNTTHVFGNRSNVEHVRITSGGNVGIGTTSPTEKLEVNGNIKLNSTSGNGLFFVTGTAPTGLSFYSQPGTADGTQLISYGSAHVILDSDNNDADTRFFTIRKNGTSFATSTELFRVTEAGNVGIGTQSPSSKLEIRGESADHRLVSINRPASNTAALYLGNDSATPANAVISSNYSDLILGRDQSGVLTEHLRIKRDGNVGIGTTSPAYKLDIGNNTSETLRISAPAVSGSYGNLLFGSSQIVSQAARIQGIYGSSWDGSLAFSTQDAGAADGNRMTEKMRITSAGNVGIGTTTPQAKLDVVGNVKVLSGTSNCFLDVGRNENEKVTLSVNDNVIIFNAVQDSDGDGDHGFILDRTFQGTGANYFDIRKAGTSQLYINSSGNVGIGTTSPSNILHTYVNNADTSIPGILVEQAGTGDSSIGFLLSGVRTWSVGVDNSDSDKFIIGSGEDLGTSARIVVDTTGNVGIGTKSPNASLHIEKAGDQASSVKGITLSSGASGTNKYLPAIVWSYGAYGTPDFAKIESQRTSGTGARILFSTASTSGVMTEAMRIQDNGNVGIGTTSPGAKLDVAGNVYISSSGRLYTDQIRGYSANSIMLGDGNTTFSFASNNSNSFAFTGGNVGIGTTNPTAKLQVAGSFKSTGINDSASAQAIFINGNGEIGIGVTNQTTALDIGGVFKFSTASDLLQINNNTNTGGINLSGNNSRVYFGGNRAIEGAQDGTNLFIGEGYTGVQIHSNATFTVNGNLGIGTTSPGAKLDVADSQPIIRITNTEDKTWVNGDNIGKLEFYTKDSSTPNGTKVASYIQAINEVGSSVPSSALAFGTSLGSTSSLPASESMRIDSSGNVGIGTSSPDAPLHVSRSTNGINQYIYNSSSGQAYIALGNATTGLFSQDFTSANGMLVGVDSDETAVIWNAENTRLRFGTNNLERLSITGSGNVGIGTTSPAYKLDVNGEAQLGYINFEYNSNYAGVRWKDSAYNLQWKLGHDGPSGNWLYLYDYAMSASAFTFKPNSDMLFTPGGNVGIGTTSPGSTLSVNGSNTGSVPLLDLTTSGTGEWQRGVRLLNSGMSAGDSIMMAVGQEDANKNMGQFYFYYAGDHSTSNRISLGLHSVDDVLNILGTGNVGIGTTNPTTKLYVDAGESTFNRGNSDGAIARFRGKNAEQAVIGTVTSWFDSNVGIGTTSPSAKLELNESSTSSTPAVLITNDTGNQVKLGVVRSLAGTAPNTALFEYDSDLRFIAGAGTTNEVIRFNSSGNVGIGTTNPGFKLTVAGGSGDWATKFSSGTASAYFAHSGGYGASIDAGTSATSSTYILDLLSNGSTRMFVRGDGNVGIGTSSPSVKLDIAAGAAAGSSDLLILSRNAGYGSTKFTQTYDSTYFTAGKTLTLTNDAGIAFAHFAGNNTGTVTNFLLPSGNVGIGTTSPGSALDVAGILTINTRGAASNPRLVFNHDNILGASFIEVDRGTEDMEFWVSGSERMRITDTGNVGIGTSSPGEKLVVNSGGASARFTGNTASSEIYLGTNGVQSQYTNIVWYTNNGNAQIWKAGTGYTAAGGAGSLNIYNSNGKIAFHPAGNFNAMTVDTNSNVGIGTTSPNAHLHINASSDAHLLLTSDNAISLYQDAAWSSTMMFGAQWNGSNQVYGATSRGAFKMVALHDGDNSPQYLAIYGANHGTAGGTVNWNTVGFAQDEDGNVGIGTTSPGAKLDVNGDVFTRGTEYIFQSVDNTTGYLYFDHSGTQVWKQGIFSDNTSTFSIGTGGGFSRLFNITNAGKVGIGTTSPLGKLHVSGGGGNGTLYIQGTSFVSHFNYGTNEDTYIRPGKAAGNVIVADSGGNVGIGTSSPSYKLDVNGTGRIVSQFIQGGGTARATSGTTIAFTNNTAYSANTDLGDAGRFLSIVNESTVTNAYSALSFRVNPNSSGGGTNAMLDMKFVNANNGSSNLIWSFTSGGGWADRMTLTSNGNVGIGTTSPVTGLDVRRASYSNTTARFGDNGPVYIINDWPIIGFNAYYDGGWKFGGNSNGKYGGAIEFDYSNGHFYIGRSTSTGNVGDALSKSAAFTILNDGNVGIGTTSPGGKLEIQTLASQGSTALILRTSDSVANATIRWQDSAGTNRAAIGSYYNVADSGALEFINGGATNMILRSSGNVGIGTTSPAYGLTVQNNNTINTEFRNSAGDALAIRLTTGVATLLSTYEVTPTNMDIAFTPTTIAGVQTEAMRIKASGKVGIGNTSPSIKLDVAASGGTSTSWSDRLGIRNSDTDNAVFSGMYNGNAVIAAHNQALTAWEDLYINTVTGTTGIVVQGDGNVGIGTTSPSYKLDVSGTARAVKSKIDITPTSDTIALDVRGTGTPNDYFTVSNATGGANDVFLPIFFYKAATYGYNGGTNRYPSGVYGGGFVAAVDDTSYPNAAGAGAAMHFNARTYANNGPLTSRYLFSWGSWLTTYMSMTAGGNLLIGTTTDSGEKLQINGNADVSGDIYADGDVGIGNDAPAYKLDVSGDINADGDFYQNGVQGATGTVNLALAGGGSVTLEINGGIITSIV